MEAGRRQEKRNEGLLRDLAVKRGEEVPQKNGTVMFQVSVPTIYP